ncbi:hypothetical protein KM031_10005 [Gemmobacter fulvus]|uniref:Ferrochelatase n=1 Tax=Gemmobacter fulvus TaxID=2840474 RepID=A0A975P4H3_9RHOB|nr:hypothetical protein [Gemmobacter fulvus]MBT9246686.1 hypothetical protein [Gemmobacter fulvus]MDQ1846827.1 hypothetical protein [Gemmobacter fulvus]QWK89207.1 hypothetical protein KM031_10005 [Gemmobacter fulvus]
MNKLSALLAASALVVSASAAFAGGPVVVEVEPTPVAVVAPASSGSLGGAGSVVAAVAGVALVAAALSSGSH